MQPYISHLYLLSHHHLRSFGEVFRNPSKLPYDKKIRAKIAPATARHIGGDVGGGGDPICPQLLVKQRIHIGNTLASKILTHYRR